MSGLKIFAPDERGLQRPLLRVWNGDPDTPTPHDPDVVSWGSARFSPRNPSWMELVTRSRIVYRNRLCKSCGRPTVSPVSAGPVLHSKGGQPIPGTGELVGFHCDYCSAEWPA